MQCITASRNAANAAAGIVVQKSKKVPNNEGKVYFKWDMGSRILLLLEARDKEVWNTPYKQNEKVWREITTILQTYPNYERVFETLNWRKCVDEYKRNIDLYEKERAGI